MKDELKLSLQGIFESKALSDADAKLRAAATAEARAASLAEFYKICEQVIEPAMQEVGAIIKSNGLDFRISSVKDEKRNNTGPENSIRFTIITDSSNHPLYEYPGLSVIFDKFGGSVHFHASTIAPGRGGTSGGDGSMKLSELTADLIQTRIVAIAQKVFR